ncbi:MAG TPA: serine hydrolase domain-containing protein [Gemmatimonadales bacterium]|jgi:CubicO group peptidase (beta-lactamase class C family)|nr:serine hydrolase domain-containing protein [Gemmatimonadales bacterium]
MKRVVPALLLLTVACARASRFNTPAPAADPLSLAAPYLDSMVVLDSASPGAVVGISVHGRHYFHASGHLGVGLPQAPDSSTVYDLASLTKVIGLTTAMMIAVDEHRIELDAPIQRYVPAFQGKHKEQVTVRHLLTHSSGLPAWRALYRQATSRADAYALADTTPLDTLPGTRFVYSDLGAIVMAQAIESVYHERLDSLLHRRLFAPLGMDDTRYLPPDCWIPRIAPTENDPWRGRTLRGEVHDENAARLGGVSGHAGLFSSARDLLRFGDWLLEGLGTHDTSAMYLWPPPPASERRFVIRQDIPEGSSRALGWDTPSGLSSGGQYISREKSFGHTGFTGTSIWIDPTRDLVIVLLSNRVNPTRDNDRWGPVRRNVADRVVEALEGRRSQVAGR